jgi:hypothetical protein
MAQKPDKKGTPRQFNKKTTLLIAAAAALIVSAVWFNSCKQANDNAENKAIIPAAPSSGQKENTSLQQTGESKPSEESSAKIVKSVKIFPQNPTALDALKTEIAVNNEKGGIINYKYLWLINNKIVPDSDSEMLNPGAFKKDDIVSVRVIPYKYGVEKAFTESSPVLIQNAAPALEMKSQQQKAAAVIELQLAASDPDGDKITFALEEPRIEGMVLDANSGKITFTPKKLEKGIYKFKASASDSSGGKVTKDFEIKIDFPEVKK